MVCSFQKFELLVGGRICDFCAFQHSQCKVSRCAPAFYEAFPAVELYLVPESETEYSVWCLIALSDSASQNLGLVCLPIVASYRLHQVNRTGGNRFHHAGNATGVAGMGLVNSVFFPRVLGYVSVRFRHRHLECFAKPSD